MTEQMELHEILGSKMYLYTDDPGLSAQLRQNGIREKAATEVFQQEIRPGMKVLDVGANLGYYALQAAKLVGSRGKVYAVEPVPRNIAALQASAKANGYKTRIETFELAMAAEDGETEMQLAAASNWGHMGSMEGLSERYRRRRTLRDTGQPKIKVKTRTVDSFIKENKITRIDFIRMDVEGFEIEIIKGMAETLRTMPELKVMIEFHYSHFESPREIYQPVFKQIMDAGLDPKIIIARKADQVIRDVTRYDLADRIDEIDGAANDCPHVLFEKRKNKLSILIPAHPDGPERKKILDWTMRRYKTILPDAEIVQGQDDYGGAGFCKARAVNNAAAKATGDIFLIADMDMIATKDNIETAIGKLDHYPIVIPYNPYHRLNQETSDAILRQAPTTGLPKLTAEAKAIYERTKTQAGGLQIVTRAVFNAAGKYDERFVGWGGEDVSFCLAVEKLFGKGLIVQGDAYHLDHPRQKDQPRYRRESPNMKLRKAYESAGTRDTMKLLTAPNRAQKIDIFATGAHYLHHMLPIWNALPEELRGNLFVNSSQLQTETSEHNTEVYRPGNRPLLIAGFWGTIPAGRDLILMNHGAGQAYYAADGHLRSGGPGGPGREKVKLFMDPNEYASDLNKRAYPDAEHVIIGCPKLDNWHLRTRAGQIKKRDGKPVIAISFHFDSRTCPESMSAWPHYQGVQELLANQTEWWEVLGHGHPRMQRTLQPAYDQAGIETVKDFDDIMERADLYICDHMSTLYEFASTGRPVVVLNAPWYRRDVEHGLRYWEHADVGVNCNEPDQLVAAIFEALEDKPEQQAKRQKAVEAVYAYRDGKCADRAAAAIKQFLQIYTPSWEAAATPGLKIYNRSNNPIERAGIIFHPGTTELPDLPNTRLREIRACQHLIIC